MVRLALLTAQVLRVCTFVHMRAVVIGLYSAGEIVGVDVPSVQVSADFLDGGEVLRASEERKGFGCRVSECSYRVASPAS